MDGTLLTLLFDEILGPIQSPSFDHGSTALPYLLPPTPLDWKITRPLEASINKAKSFARSIADSQTLSIIETSYGRNFIKKADASPDFWAQMVIQLAYHRLIGRDGHMAGTQEECVSTGRFKHGRVEAHSVPTAQSVAWVKSMFRRDVSRREKRRLFAEACHMHSRNLKESAEGRGTDGHLMGTFSLLAACWGPVSNMFSSFVGLRCVLRSGEKVPEMFNDPVFSRLKHCLISTAHNFTPNVPMIGWGQAVSDGVGVPYTVANGAPLIISSPIVLYSQYGSLRQDYFWYNVERLPPREIRPRDGDRRGGAQNTISRT